MKTCFLDASRVLCRRMDYLGKIEQAGFRVNIIDEDKEISKTQYNGLALESIKIEATK